MIQVQLLEELREIRRRLAEECQGDVERYARMLEQSSLAPVGVPVSKPLLPPAPGLPQKASA